MSLGDDREEEEEIDIFSFSGSFETSRPLCIFIAISRPNPFETSCSSWVYPTFLQANTSKGRHIVLS